MFPLTSAALRLRQVMCAVEAVEKLKKQGRNRLK